MKRLDKRNRYGWLHALVVAALLALHLGRIRDEASPAPRRWLPKTASTLGAVFYSAVGGVVSWVLIELPQHLDIVWR